VTARELSTWNPALGSADADLLGDLSTLVARNRDLARNNGVAAGILQAQVDNIVGTGLRLAAKPDYRALGRSKEWADAWARAVEARWRVHAESVYCDAGMELTFHGQTQLVCRSGMLRSLAIITWTSCLSFRLPAALRKGLHSLAMRPFPRLAGRR